MTPARKCIQAGPGGIHLSQDFFGVPQKLFASLREQHPTPRAIHESATHLRLECFDGVADRALREEKFLRCTRKALAACKRGKGGQLSAVERAIHQ